MRLFIAINLPLSVQIYLRSVQNALPRRDVGARMTFPSDFHLTLKFLGYVSDVNYKRLVDLLNEVVAAFAGRVPLEISLSKISFFKKGRMISVIFAEVKLPPLIFELQHTLEEKLSKIDFTREHNFVPHVTLARVKNYEDQAFSEKLSEIKIQSLKWEVTSFSLMESILSQAGARYIEKAKFLL